MNAEAILRQIQDGLISPEQGYMQLEDLDLHPMAYYSNEYVGEDRNNEPQTAGQHIMVFSGDNEEIDEILLHMQDNHIIHVRKGKAFRKISPRQYELNSLHEADYAQLFKEIAEENVNLQRIVYAWTNEEWTSENLKHNLYQCIQPVLLLTKSLIENMKEANIFFYYVYEASEEQAPYHEGFSGYLKTFVLENARFNVKCISFEGPMLTGQAIEQEILCKSTKKFEEIRCTKLKRLVKKWIPFPEVSEHHSFVRENGTYIITGGAGKLGLQFAQMLLHEEKCHVILLGRTKYDSDIQEKMNTLDCDKESVEYFECDITDDMSVGKCMEEIRDKYSSINGIIHGAGIIADNFIIHKTYDEFLSVMAPKILGTLYLDKHTKNESPDFFITCSSIAGNVGNVGQCDYAYGNSFMDAYIQQTAKYRTGKYMTINWPLWENGGMNTTNDKIREMKEEFGIVPLSNQGGKRAIYAAMQCHGGNITPLEGDVQRINQSLNQLFQPKHKEVKSVLHSRGNEEEMLVLAEMYLKSKISDETKIPSGRIEADRDFEDYGIDSVMIMNLNKEFDKDFNHISKTLFYEYKNIAALAKYFADNHAAELVSGAEHVKKDQAGGVKSVSEDTPGSMTAGARFYQDKVTGEMGSWDDQVAIIGIDGMYPQADNLELFWKNLCEGMDCVTEIPTDRWDWKKGFHPDRNHKGTTYTKWGGFLDNIDKFDPIFFRISPKEARAIDPQERLFLETAWKTLEGAGYTRKRLKEYQVGVFAGVMYGHYQMYGAEESINGNPMALNSSFSSIANRVSYFMDLSGPSIALDTMCSSSLTAIHLACESIKRGECQMAFAGGVNLSLHPNKYLMLSQGKFASSEGKCRSFGEGGDGYVPGEGVGIVLLKSLRLAKRDKDSILGVIRGTAVNHGGKTNGYSVPNPNAQFDVIRTTLEKANVSPESIQYIETHGTGTSLGDPIEITGLTKAFLGSNVKKQTCAIGSVKSNIGHLESAAGVASLTKVILQMQYQKLVPSIHSSVLNQNIKFEDTPFYVQQECVDWNSRSDDSGKICPRRAGISGFGAGGSNAHMIVEEYIDNAHDMISPTEKRKIFVISAKDKKALTQYVEKILHWIENQTNEKMDSNTAVSQMTDIVGTILSVPAFDIDIHDSLMEMGIQTDSAERLIEMIENRFSIQLNLDELLLNDSVFMLAEYISGQQPVHNELMYAINATLQLGREAFEERMACVAEDMRELVESLKDYVHGKTRYNVFTRNLTETDENHQVSDSARYSDNQLIAARWVRGMAIQWEENDASMLRLPTYPFQRESYWYHKSSIHKKAVTQVHPLVEEVEGSDNLVHYFKTLTMEDAVIGEHIVSGSALLPGAAYVEMGRYACERAAGQRVSGISNLIWKRPLSVEDKMQVEIQVNTDEMGTVFQVTGNDGKVYCQGNASFEKKNPENSGTVDINQIKSQLKPIKTKKEVYDYLQSLGFAYGKSFQVTNQVYEGERESLVELEAALTQEQFVVNPFLLDGAFRAVGGIRHGRDKGQKVPFSLGNISIYRTMSGKCFVHARLKQEFNQQFVYDFTIVSEHGEIIAELRDFTARPLKPQYNMHYYRPVLREQTANHSEEHKKINSMLIFTNANANHEKIHLMLEKKHGKQLQVIFVTSGSAFEKKDDRHYVIRHDVSNDYEQLLEILKKQEVLLTHVVYQGFVDSGETHYQVTEAVKNIFVSVTSIYKENRIRCLFVYEEEKPYDMTVAGSIIGLSKSTSMLNILFELVTVGFRSVWDLEGLWFSIYDECCQTESKCGTQVIYLPQGRMIMGMEKIVLEENQKESYAHGVFIITGGAGGIGRKLAEHMAEDGHVTLILTGRSPYSEGIKAFVNRLQKKHNLAEYIQSDITSEHDVKHLIHTVKKKYRGITGIFHCAGLDGRDSMLEADSNTFRQVLLPKMRGTWLLDRETSSESLKYFVVFSSVASLIGDFGVGSYSAANGFLDYFSHGRNALVSEGKRSGKTIAVNWSLWKDGGMGLDNTKELDAIFGGYSGLKGLNANEALSALRSLLAANESQIAVIAGDEVKINKMLKIKADQEKLITPFSEKKERGSELADMVTSYLKELLSGAIDLPAEKINNQTSFEEYGVDSVIIMELNHRIEKDFKFLPKMLFFEYTTIKQLREFLCDKFSNEMAAHFKIDKGDNMYQPKEQEAEYKPEVKEVHAVLDETHKTYLTSNGSGNDIAIIGIHGKFPMAENLDEYWTNLVNSKDCIEEIPAERWNHARYFSRDKTELGKTYSKWGGFVPDIDKFDAGFFRISPLEAENMDPQERVFLEVAWKAFEDAGYTRDGLSKKDVGVFVGAMYGHYQLLALEQSMEKECYVAGSVFSTIANRVSYFMGLSGPSMAVDTACSSSLEAIRLACQNIRDGICQMAIAGGINLTVHPNKYLYLSQAGFLSTDGKCRSFGAGGDGYVPGEGAGAVILKRLSDAESDGDHIYGVIKGMSVKHTGNSNGYGVPNISAQESLLRDVLERANISPESIGYIESAALGIEMGDKVETEAMNRVFNGTSAYAGCAIGSVKSNIGHLESASGMAALMKVLLQMKYRELVPSIHAEQLNPLIQFSEMPFQVQQKREHWNILEENMPRRALINSFGAGGTYLNMIVDEYRSKKTKQTENGTYIFVLSAKTSSRLKEYAENVAAFVEKNDMLDLTSFHYMLQTGREAMDERIAWIVRSKEELYGKLQAYIRGDIQSHSITQEQSGFSDLFSGKTGAYFIKMLIQNNEPDKIAQLWMSGVSIPWEHLYSGKVIVKMPVPTYPFEKVSYWIRKKAEAEHFIQDRDVKKQRKYIPGAQQGLDGDTLNEEYVKELVAEYLRIPIKDIRADVDLRQYGFDSIVGMRLANRLKKEYGNRISIKMLFECKTIEQLCSYIKENAVIYSKNTRLEAPQVFDEEFYSCLIDELLDDQQIKHA